tara:strand:+ start:321 stop:614 length:294 start_codon:yes stop_codon:yes gene_type:complete
LAKRPVQLVEVAYSSSRYITTLLSRKNYNAPEITAVDIDHQSLEMLTSSADNSANISPVCLDLEGKGLKLVGYLGGKLFELALFTKLCAPPLARPDL